MSCRWQHPQTYCWWSTETRTTERYGEAVSIVGGPWYIGIAEKQKLEQQKGTVKLCPLWGSVVHWQSKSCCWHSPCTTSTTEMSLQTYCRWSTETRTTERYGEALSIVGAHGTLEQQKNNNWNDNWTTERNTEALSIAGIHGTLVVKALLLTLALY